MVWNEGVHEGSALSNRAKKAFNDLRPGGAK